MSYLDSLTVHSLSVHGASEVKIIPSAKYPCIDVVVTHANGDTFNFTAWSHTRSRPSVVVAVDETDKQVSDEIEVAEAAE